MISQTFCPHGWRTAFAVAITPGLVIVLVIAIVLARLTSLPSSLPLLPSLAFPLFVRCHFACDCHCHLHCYCLPSYVCLRVFILSVLFCACALGLCMCVFTCASGFMTQSRLAWTQRRKDDTHRRVGEVRVAVSMSCSHHGYFHLTAVILAPQHPSSRSPAKQHHARIGRCERIQHGC